MPKIDAQLGVRLTKDLKRRLTAQARRERKSVSALVVQVMEAYLAGRQEDGPPPQNDREL